MQIPESLTVMISFTAVSMSYVVIFLSKIRSDAPASIIGGTNIHISHFTSLISFEICCSHGLWTQIYEYSQLPRDWRGVLPPPPSPSNSSQEFRPKLEHDYSSTFLTKWSLLLLAFCIQIRQRERTFRFI